jgi:hypothetical protein
MMEGGERYYAYMAIPFALAVYQTFVTEIIALLRADGKDSSRRDPVRLYLGEIHPYVGSLGITLPAVELEQFTLAVKIRNRVVHAAGALGNLVATYSALSSGARGAWTRRGGAALRALSSGAPPLVASDVNATWAVTHALARALNLELGGRSGRM